MCASSSVNFEIRSFGSFNVVSEIILLYLFKMLLKFNYFPFVLHGIFCFKQPFNTV